MARKFKPTVLFGIKLIGEDLYAQCKPKIRIFNLHWAYINYLYNKLG
jgi:hypothetical protein